MSDDKVYRLAKQSETDPTEYILSDESVDRYGDVISADGWNLKNFKSNPIALFNHNPNAIVGAWENVRIEAGRLVGRLKLGLPGTSPLVDEVRRLVEQRILKAVSVGFKPIKAEPLDAKADPDWGPFRYVQQELVECSLVAVPANPNALQISRTYSLPADIRQQLRGKVAKAQSPAPEPAPPGKIARKQPEKTGSYVVSKKLSQRIKEAQERITSLKDQLVTLSELDEPNEEEIALMAELPEQIADLEAGLERDQRIEQTIAVRTVEDDTTTRQQQQQRSIPEKRPYAIPAKKFQPRDLLVRGAVVQFLAHVNKQSPENILRAVYPQDEAVGMLVRAAVNPAMTTVPTWAQELVQQAIGDYLDTLPRDSIYPALSRMGARFTFGRNGSIKIPARAATPNVSGAWVGEGEPIPVRRMGFTSVTLTPKKLGVISTFTRELAMHSTPAIEGVIREAMAEDTAVTIDATLIDANPATNIRPAGLLNGVTPLTAAPGGGSEAMIADLRALIGAITTSLGGRNIAVLINPAQGLAINFSTNANGEFLFASTDELGRRVGVTFIPSPTVPAGTVIAIDAADFASAAGDAPEYDVSDQATIHEEDTAPLPIVGGGATPTTASPVRSLWQTASIGVRMLLDMNWAMRRTGMVATVTGVTW
jgi:HK97 family phage major capsid protein/HK97 family phage prohead protease